MGKKKSYNRMYDETATAPIEPQELNPIDPVVIEPETVPEEVSTPVLTTGVVVGCNSLNVREEPDRKASILTILMADTEIQVDGEELLDEWYHVYTASGLDGFCMKQYIAIKE